MKLQKNRLLVSIVSAIVIVTVGYLTFAVIFRPWKNLSQVAGKSEKKFNVELVYDVDRQKLNGQSPNRYLITSEIEALNKRADGWAHQPFHVTADNHIATVLQDLYESDTSMIINSFHLPRSIGFWEMYPLDQQYSTIEQLFKLAEKVRPHIISPPSVNSIDNYTVELGYVNPTDTAVIRKLFSDTSFTRLASADAVFVFGNRIVRNKEKFVSIYAIKKPGGPPLNENHIEDAVVYFPRDNPREIDLALTHTGSRIFGELTKKNVNRAIAISVDNFIVSAPRVFSPVFEGKISISGNFTEAEANQLAFQMRCKPLPFPITLNRHETKEAEQYFYNRKIIYFGFLCLLILLSILTYALYPFLGIEKKMF